MGAVGTALDMGAAMNSDSLREGVLALDDYVAINSAIGHMVASAGQQKTMAVYDAFKKLVPADAPGYLMSTVNGADAQTAYNALMEFKNVVKARLEDHKVPVYSFVQVFVRTGAAQWP